MSGVETPIPMTSSARAAHPARARVKHGGERRQRSAARLAAYVAGRGILHLTLLSMVGVFLFPFLWMLATSVKTDEEVLAARILPTIPRWRGQSPYVRAPVKVTKPAQVPVERWDAESEHLQELALSAVVGKLSSGADLAEYQRSAATALHESIVSKLGVSAWSRDRAGLEAAYRLLLTPAEIDHALDEALARLELFDFQIRSLDARIFRISGGATMARAWSVESGTAAMAPIGEEATRVSYSFASSADHPIVLRTEFELPVAMSEVHRVILSIRPDDSWHQCDVTMDVGETRWVSERTTYLAQHRPMSIVLQPPTYDDQTFKQKLWVPLRAEAAPKSTGSDRKAVLRLILRPSSTAGAIYGKVQRNYARAFYAMPFWIYVRNSVLLVALTTLGTLFSSAFVAYGFARLNWPGRSVAFVILLCTMMLPAQVTMIPSFLIWRQLGWYNTLNPMWVPAFFGSAFFIFLMVQHMKTIPRELEESARIDGLNALQTWYYIILPQVKPAAAAVAIMTFMGAWNEFMGPLVYLRDQSRFPLSLGLFGLRLENLTDWSMLMAGNVLMTLPVIVIFFLCQKYFVEGVTMSGMKA